MIFDPDSLKIRKKYSFYQFLPDILDIFPSRLGKWSGNLDCDFVKQLKIEKINALISNNSFDKCCHGAELIGDAKL